MFAPTQFSSDPASRQGLFWTPEDSLAQRMLGVHDFSYGAHCHEVPVFRVVLSSVDERDDNAKHRGRFSYHWSVSPRPLRCSFPKENKQISLAEKTGLHIIPLCSPCHRKTGKTAAAVVQFTAEEIARYQVRWEEGYDIPDAHSGCECTIRNPHYLEVHAALKHLSPLMRPEAFKITIM